MGSPLVGKSVAVVGASRGLGLEWTRQFLSKGNQVYATSRSPSRGLEDLQRQHSEQLSLSQVDVAQLDSVQSWTKGLKAQVPRLDVVIVNAGVYDEGRAGLSHVSPDDMLYCFNTNTLGPLLVVQQLVQVGLLKKGSLVANMTSKMGSIADNGSGGSYAYRASKAALNAVTKSMSLDLGRQGVTCVLLHPGYVRTDMTGGQGFIDVEESVSGLISVLESNLPLSGHFYDFKHEEVPW